MTSRDRILLSTLAACLPLLALCGPLLAVPPEVIVDATEGVAEPIPLSFGNHTSGGAIDSPEDTDRFQFDADADDTVICVVNALNGALDPRFELLDPVGNLVAEQFCINGCSLVMEVVIPVDGVYTLRLTDTFFDESGEYDLSVHELDSELTCPLLYDVPAQIGTLEPTTDVDEFEFEGASGTQIQLIVDVVGGAVDPHLEVYDPNGDIISDSFCINGCVLATAILPLTVDGTYLARVYDENFDETADYDISLTCVFGDCAAPPATFIRGDVSNDGTLALNDALALLNHLFVPGSPAPTCADPADVNDDGSKGLVDALQLLNFLFVPGSPAPGLPFPGCGDDPTFDTLVCIEAAACL